MFNLQPGKPRKVPIHRIELGDTVLHAECGNMRVVNQVSDSRRLPNHFNHVSQVSRPIAEHHERWRVTEPFDTFECHFQSAWRREYFWMCNHPKEFVHTGPRYRPRISAFRQRRHQTRRPLMVNGFPTHRIYQDIRIDCDQLRPPIISYRASRSSSTDSGTSIFPSGCGFKLSLNGFCGCGPAKYCRSAFSTTVRRVAFSSAARFFAVRISSSGISTVVLIHKSISL